MGGLPVVLRGLSDHDGIFILAFVSNTEALRVARIGYFIETTRTRQQSPSVAAPAVRYQVSLKRYPTPYSVSIISN